MFPTLGLPAPLLVGMNDQISLTSVSSSARGGGPVPGFSTFSRTAFSPPPLSSREPNDSTSTSQNSYIPALSSSPLLFPPPIIDQKPASVPRPFPGFQTATLSLLRLHALPHYFFLDLPSSLFRNDGPPPARIPLKSPETFKTLSLRCWFPLIVFPSLSTPTLNLSRYSFPQQLTTVYSGFPKYRYLCRRRGFPRLPLR